MTPEDADEVGKLRQEFFSAANKERLMEKMDSRLTELEARGEVMTRRIEIDAGELPDVLAGLTASIITAHNKGQKRRLKKQAIKLIEGI